HTRFARDWRTDVCSPDLALRNCIMTIMGIKARDNGIDIRGTEIEITKIMASSPRRVAEVVVEFTFPKKNYTEEEKKLIESVAGRSEERRVGEERRGGWR